MKKATILILILFAVFFVLSLNEKPKIIGPEDISIEELSAPAEDEKIISYGVFTTYNRENMEMAKDGKTVLFFDAPWCLSCREFVEDIRKNLTKIPENVFILSVDFDSNLDLRTKYKVSQPHTFVQIKNLDQVVKKWSGSKTLGDCTQRVL